MPAHTIHKKIFDVRFVALALLVVLAGLLRYEWIFLAHPWETVQQFQDRYIYSDMFQYWQNAQKVWSGGPWGYADTLYPPGTGAFFAPPLGPHMDRVSLWQIAQWLESMWLFLGCGMLAFILYGRRAAAITLLLAAFAFPLFDYSAYMLSETPFASVLLAAFICTALAMQKRRASWLLLAGLLFGLSASFKSIGLLAGVFLLPLPLLPAWNRRLSVCATACGLLCAGLLLGILPSAYVMTQRNGGHFLVLSHDILRVAIANHGELRGATVLLPDGGSYTVENPVDVQKDLRQMRIIDLQTTNVMAENAKWVRSHPLQALSDFLERTSDLVFGTLPFPTVTTPARAILQLSQVLMVLLIYLPAAAWAMRAKKRRTRSESLRSLVILLPLLSLLASALIAATEPRYLHPFAPLLIVFASLWYAERFRLREAKPTLVSKEQKSSLEFGESGLVYS